MSPFSGVHGGQHDTNMWHSSCYCMRNSWLTKLGVLCLNQLVPGKSLQDCKELGQPLSRPADWVVLMSDGWKKEDRKVLLLTVGKDIWSVYGWDWSPTGPYFYSRREWYLILLLTLEAHSCCGRVVPFAPTVSFCFCEALPAWRRPLYYTSPTRKPASRKTCKLHKRFPFGGVVRTTWGVTEAKVKKYMTFFWCSWRKKTNAPKRWKIDVKPTRPKNERHNIDERHEIGLHLSISPVQKNPQWAT